jgi:serine phosphatase RsbU (regulator of sigma subunit)
MIDVHAVDATADAAISVLLIEDDPGDALLAREMLASSVFPFHIEPVRDLAGALARLRGGVDCVLLDLGLPDVGGLEALNEILTAAPSAAVIVLTGRADRDLALAAMARGAQDYLQKGELNGELLGRSIRYAVQRKRSEEAARRLLANELLAAESARLERGLLARPILGSAGWRSAARYRSGGGSLLLGGDFYDAIELPDGTMRILIGDVSGHGPDEAAIGVALRIAWRGFVLAGVDGDTILPNVQAVLDAERLHESLFATACDATIAADRSTVTLRLAGHPPPLLMAAEATQLDLEPGLPLGVFDSRRWEPAVVDLPPRWALIFYTDGIIEGRVAGEATDRLGSAGLVRALDGVSWSADHLGKLADHLLAIAEEQNGGPVADDIALFLIAPPDG